MRFWWIIIFITECVVKSLCNVQRLKFKRDSNNNNKTKHDRGHDHHEDHTIIWVLVGVLCGIVVIGLCVGIIVALCCCWKKKKTKKKTPESKVLLSNSSALASVNEKGNAPQIPSSGAGSGEKKVSSIFGSDPKVEDVKPRAPKTPSSKKKKKKVKHINSKERSTEAIAAKKPPNRRQNLYMKTDQESSIIDENKINPPGKNFSPKTFTAVGSKENNTPTTTAAGTTVNTKTIQSRNSSNIPTSKTVQEKPIASVGGGKTFESDFTKQQATGETSTSYEEAEKKSLEPMEGPNVPPGYRYYRARGPNAPDHIAPEKWKHKGDLVLKKRQKLMLKHELDNDPPAEPPKSHEHVEFDSKMNEVVDIGPGVEKIISNKSLATSTTNSTQLQLSSKASPPPPSKQQTLPPTNIHRISPIQQSAQQQKSSNQKSSIQQQSAPLQSSLQQSLQPSSNKQQSDTQTSLQKQEPSSSSGGAATGESTKKETASKDKTTKTEKTQEI